MPYRLATLDREFDKFVENPAGETSVRVLVSNGAGQEIPVTGTFSIGGATTPKIYNLSMPLANTEYSQALSAGTKKITVRMRNKGRAQIAFVSGQSGTLFITLEPGAVYSDENLSLTGATIYLQSTAASQTAEILEWS